MAILIYLNRIESSRFQKKMELWGQSTYYFKKELGLLEVRKAYLDSNKAKTNLEIMKGNSLDLTMLNVYGR